MNKEEVVKILSELEQGYDLIADKFSDTRAFMWRDLEFVRGYVKPGDRVLDFGCGNGRLVGFLSGERAGKGVKGEMGGMGERGISYVGVDISQNLIDIAEQKYSSEKTKFIKINSPDAKLPFVDNCFDSIFSIAVFHHLPGIEYRLEVAKELHRVLKPGGKIVISVWNLWQRRFCKYHLRECKNKVLGKSKLDWGDLYISFKTNEGEIFMRYHHAFTQSELVRLLNKSGFDEIRCAKNLNIVCTASKK